MRRAGVLLPISCIPSKYGIGCFSKEAYDVVDFLKKAGQKLWQILPLGPTSYGDSPYQSFSCFAGNPYFIDLEKFVENGWITQKDCEDYDYGNNPIYIDYEKMYLSRFKVLRKAFEASHIQNDKDFLEFCEENKEWLDDYSLFMAIKNAHDDVCWIQWPEELKLRKPEAIKKAINEYKNDILFHRFLQYEFFIQWMELKIYANKQGIKVVGDIPIYAALDSSDVWAKPQLFQLDEKCQPTRVAGCPPDAFSDDGQLWGNPLYTWDYHQKTGFDWWMRRFKKVYSLYDIVRIDHFRAFDEYFSIPFGDKTARNGEWITGPGFELFEVMKQKLGKKEVIAEDLGFLTPSVLKLVKKTGFPGMKVLLFAFNAKEPSSYLPHNYDRNCIVYTGTHDNDTIEGWIKSASRADVGFARKYLGVKSNKQLRNAMLRAGLASVADTFIAPIQDYIGLDNAARINRPSTLGGNWEWRLSENQLSDELADEMAELVKIYAR